jgi:hypothetical protein
MSGEGSQGNREVPPKNRPLKEGGPWGKQGFPHGSEPEASDAHQGTMMVSVVAVVSVVGGGAVVVSAVVVSGA